MAVIGTYTTTTTLSLIMVGVNFSATNMTTLGSKAIEQAENEVNKYLSKRYDLASSTFNTASSIPPLVRSLAEKLAEANMWAFLSRGGAGKESVARAASLRKDALDNLLLIQTYKADLLNTTGSLIDDFSNTSQRVLCNTSNYSSTFDEDDELNWAVDSDKLSDIADNRD